MGEQRGSVLGDQPVSVDEWRRLEALKAAVKLTAPEVFPGTGSYAVVQTAREFEKYLKGGGDE